MVLHLEALAAELVHRRHDGAHAVEAGVGKPAVLQRHAHLAHVVVRHGEQELALDQLLAVDEAGGQGGRVVVDGQGEAVTEVHPATLVVGGQVEYAHLSERQAQVQARFHVAHWSLEHDGARHQLIARQRRLHFQRGAQTRVVPLVDDLDLNISIRRADNAGGFEVGDVSSVADVKAVFLTRCRGCHLHPHAGLHQLEEHVSGVAASIQGQRNVRVEVPPVAAVVFEHQVERAALLERRRHVERRLDAVASLQRRQHRSVLAADAELGLRAEVRHAAGVRPLDGVGLVVWDGRVDGALDDDGALRVLELVLDLVRLAVQLKLDVIGEVVPDAVVLDLKHGGAHGGEGRLDLEEAAPRASADAELQRGGDGRLVARHVQLRREVHDVAGVVEHDVNALIEHVSHHSEQRVVVVDRVSVLHVARLSGRAVVELDL